MSIRKILVPYDFSPHAREAMRWAIDLASSHDGGIALLHVMQPPAFPAAHGGAPLVDGDTLARVRAQLAGDLERARMEVEAAGVPASATVVDGVPFVEVISLARRGGFDLIAMGTHGRTGVAHALLGSVAERVVREAPCPVLTVRLPGQPSPRQ